MTNYWLPARLHERDSFLAALIAQRLGDDVLGPIDYWLEMPERLVEEPTRPQTATRWGTGFLCVDLGPDDHQTWNRFSNLAAEDSDPESVASRAQVWRLPVTPYRQNCQHLTLNDTSSAVSVVDMRGRTVIDMTTMWAGPLCTEILARAGARVIKIEPASRPDGLRYGDGDDGSGRAPMFMELNRSKEIADIDLRYCVEGGEFHRLVRSADLVITSLSPRANENLGLTPANLFEINPKLAILSISAFASSSNESDWVSYGTGVHAMSGLGWRDNRPLTPAFSYPDPIAGLEACLTALGQLTQDVSQCSRVSLDRSTSSLVEP